jgi:stringent starvation protein B
MTSSRPYLLRAIYDWIVDNGCTPHVIVNATLPAVRVPVRYVKDGQIVLNVAPSAVSNLVMDDHALACSARFGGVAQELYVPVSAIIGIYARENGRGMMFEAEPDPQPPADGNLKRDDGKGGERKGRGKESRPSLKVVK